MPFLRRVRALALALGLLLLIPAFLSAGDVEITVEDEDLGLPLEGAVISLRDGRQFMCDEDGKARFELPNDWQTVVQVSYPGYEGQRLTITARSGSVQEISIALRLGGIMMGRELVVEAQRPETSETRSGRSVAISERELARTSEIGIIEDVMSAVKLLPGVGYTGMFGALPSIRGGDPGDLTAVFDGFYLETPYHWIGAVSIFDPKMVSSARLSHGVFSSRYGHSISGLLEVTSKSPSATEAELETAISTSAASINLSYPLNGKGGILFMGKVTYWDTLVWAAKGLSKVIDNENLAQINAVSTSPYIRSAAVAANYRFTQDLEWRLNAFFGSDGVGAKSVVEYDDEGIDGFVDFSADYDNYQGFLISGITASPSPVLALKATGGAGFTRRITDDMVKNDVTVRYNDDFLDLFPPLIADGLRAQETYTAPNVNANIMADHTIFNAQVRGDLDWDLGKGFITAFGVQELYSRWAQNQRINLALEFPLAELSNNMDRLPPEIGAMLNNPMFSFLKDIPGLAIVLPMGFSSELLNHGLTTSAYGLLEYTSPNQRFGAELGLRVDHLFFMGKDFSAQTLPALNPRLNIDFNILKNRGSIDSLDITAGTGLFSSINTLVSFVDGDRVSVADTLKFNRSWTTIAGVKVDLEQGYSFNIEGYYKYIFDRAYIDADIVSSPDIQANFYFDGIGHVGGFDLQLQKLESRYWDGWISYTFTWAQYYDPNAGGEGVNQGGVNGTGAQWYFPSFHRFHNANIVLNIKPLRWFNIATRFGFASGQLSSRSQVVSEIYSYPVIYIDDNGDPVIIQKYRRDTEPLEPERDPWSLSWDLKFSFFRFDRKGRVTTEIYLAAENLMSLFYTPQRGGNTRFNEYTGKEDDAGGGGGGMFDLPIPLVSFGFKWRY
ncbi:MAG: TonB-dependent receptor [Treponema sp.]|jgi:hypothetical protein|nr:TonB-dependent receptor [Treponema sp.]